MAQKTLLSSDDISLSDLVEAAKSAVRMGPGGHGPITVGLIVNPQPGSMSARTSGITEETTESTVSELLQEDAVELANTTGVIISRLLRQQASRRTRPFTLQTSIRDLQDAGIFSASQAQVMEECANAFPGPLSQEQQKQLDEKLRTLLDDEPSTAVTAIVNAVRGIVSHRESIAPNQRPREGNEGVAVAFAGCLAGAAAGASLVKSLVDTAGGVGALPPPARGAAALLTGVLAGAGCVAGAAAATYTAGKNDTQ